MLNQIEPQQSQVIDDEDDIDYDNITLEIDRTVAGLVRNIPEKQRAYMKETPLKSMEIGEIISSFNCTICMDLV